MGILQGDPPRRDDWALTRWSVVAKLGVERSGEWAASWADLVQTYRMPMERYVRRVLSRSRGRDVSQEEAADVVQEFLAACVEKGWLSRADPQRGRFRAYLQTLLRRYSYRVMKRDAAARRRPECGHHLVSLDHADQVPAPTEQEKADLDEFSRGWVAIAVDRALARLGAKHERFPIVIADLIATAGEGSDDLAARLGVRKARIPVIKFRARQLFGELFEAELAQTVGDQSAFDEEWRAIRGFLPAGL